MTELYREEHVEEGQPSLWAGEFGVGNGEPTSKGPWNSFERTESCRGSPTIRSIFIMCLSVSVSVKRHHDHAVLIKKNHLIWR